MSNRFFWPVAIFSLLATSHLFAAPVCQPITKTEFKCSISQLADCQQVNDYPYARNLYCPSAYLAVQKMRQDLANKLALQGQGNGYFYFYQTKPTAAESQGDTPAQTTTPCLNTQLPTNSKVVGGGLPLCHLLAYSTSLGPVVNTPLGVPDTLHSYPQYFSQLMNGVDLSSFKTGSRLYDPLVKGLGEMGYEQFIQVYPNLATKPYLPSGANQQSQIGGISGGGGAGWGAEIKVRANGQLHTLLAYGGGGGGGLVTSTQTSGKLTTALGAGGGAGMQFANAYWHDGVNYNGLGLGAGFGQGEKQTQYSYYASATANPAHVYDGAVIEAYAAQLANLRTKLQNNLAKGRAVVLEGGGGAGGGMEYLQPNGEEYTPHAVSTQAGFAFNYAFKKVSASKKMMVNEAEDLTPQIYQKLGDDYRMANRYAYQQCGNSYANFSCMCPKIHAMVICLVGQQLGDPKKIPVWMQQQHCQQDQTAVNIGMFAAAGSIKASANQYSSYQESLLAAVPASQPQISSFITTQPSVVSQCRNVLKGYFSYLNTAQPDVDQTNSQAP